jgi:methylated-DNA-protein-cysteine methyltransferase-like protein
MKTPDNKTDLYSAIYDIVRLIPPGRATSYGAIAAAIGVKSGARMVGYAMNNCHTLQPPVPAHRVVNSKGLLTGRFHFSPPEAMQQLLEQEGIKVTDHQIANWNSIFWDPVIELNI